MSFTPNIPAIGQSLGNSRPQILNNFAVLRSSFAVNHIDVNSMNAGMHTFIQLPEQPSGGSVAVNQGALYTKEFPSGTGFCCLVFRQEGGGSNPNKTQGAEILLSNVAPNVTSTTAAYTSLPGRINDGNLMMTWGLVNRVGLSTPVTFTTDFTFSGSPSYIGVTRLVGSGGNVSTQAIGVFNISSSGFTIGCSSTNATDQFYYIAIGIGS